MADDPFLTPARVADELHVTVVTVRRWITTGQLPASKAGRRKWMVRRSDLNAFLANERPAAQAETSEDPSFKRYLVTPGER